MEIFKTYNDQPIFLLGDIHGNFYVIINLIHKYDLHDCLIFQLGDFGIGFNYNKKGVVYLFVGGALSIDKKYSGLTEGFDYWDDEKFIYDEEKIKNAIGVNVVLTHTAPNFADPLINNDFAKKCIEGNPILEHQMIQERELVTNLYDKLSENNFIKLWVYAHFHNTNISHINGTTFLLLNVNEFRKVK